MMGANILCHLLDLDRNDSDGDNDKPSQWHNGDKATNIPCKLGLTPSNSSFSQSVRNRLVFQVSVQLSSSPSRLVFQVWGVCNPSLLGFLREGFSSNSNRLQSHQSHLCLAALAGQVLVQ